MSNNHSRNDHCPECLKLLLWQWGHGLSNKSVILTGEVDAIRSQLEAPLTDCTNVNARLDNIERIARELVNLPSPFQLEQVSINQLIDRRVEELQQLQAYAKVHFQVILDPNEALVKGNFVWLRRLFDNLVDNAIGAMGENDKGKIYINTIVRERRVSITVKDTGKGIVDQIAPSLFRKPQTFKSGGRGRGGYIARIIVDIYGGEIKVDDSSDSTGTAITVWLPLDGKP